MTTAPHELSLLGLDAARFVRSDSKSWRGPCPRCGGKRHLVVWTDHPFPKWNVQCDICGLKAWADELNTALKQEVSPEVRKAWAVRRAEDQSAREAYRAHRLAEFTADELWEEYHNRMNEQHREYWRGAGIPDAWQDYYSMGYTANKRFTHDGATFESPAFTIPIFDFGRNPINMQYRIANPPPGMGKYRQEYGLPAAAFLSNPDDPLGDECIIVEGAKKAAVLQVWLDQSPLVFGIPGVRSWAGVPERVKPCGVVWVMLDPDSGAAPRDLAKAIGKQARIVTLPVKPDDLLTIYGGTSEDITRAMREAVRL